MPRGIEPIDVFISHSSTDIQLAEALISLLLEGLPKLDPKRIRCTSVSGYRLPGGANTDDQLRAEMRTARVFVGLVTPESLNSTYVLFELGARWGAKLHMTPLVAAGMRPSELKAPLDRINAHSCSSEDHLCQLVEEVASVLSIRPSKRSTYRLRARILSLLSVTEQKRRMQAIRQLQVYATPSATYSAIPAIIDGVDRSAGTRRLLVATLHGRTTPPHKRWKSKLSKEEEDRYAAFDRKILDCIESVGDQRWHVKEFKNVATVDRLERTVERIARAKEGYEVRAVCIRHLMPCLSPMIVGDDDLLLATLDTGARRVGSAIHIRGKEAVEFASQYFSLLWDYEKTFRLRSEEGVDESGIAALRREIETLR